MERGGTVGILAVEPVAREDRELAVGGERLEALVQPLEIGARRTVALAHVVGVGGVRVQGVERIDVVQARQVIEPQDGAAMEGFDYAALRASLALVSSRTNV